MHESSTLITAPTTPMIWHGWGDPTRRPGLSPRAEALLAQEIGPLDRHTPPVPLEEVRVGPSALSDDDRRALEAIVGPDRVLDDHLTRVRHAGGKSYPDLFRRRQGDAVAAPDAVVLPGSHEEVAAVLAVAAERGVAVVPFGGGTSVVGGVEPERGGFDSLIALDLARMDRLVTLDEESLLATFEPGIRGPEAEAELRRRGYSLGHFPQSYAYASIGGYVATRSAGQASTGHGRIDQLVHAVRVATPIGELSAGVSPATAAGPDLRQVVVGSEGLLGVITEATLRIHHAPEVEVYEAHAVRSFTEGAAILRELVQAGVAPDVCRLSDVDETRTFVQQTEGVKGTALRGYLSLRGYGEGCLLILGWDGSRASVALGRAAAARVLRGHETLRLGTRPGDAWAHGRFDGPYLRDELMDRGVMVETLETATTWSAIPRLYGAVRRALHDALGDRGTPPLVLCHISHVYPSGCSLYYTWIARQDQGDELAQWRAAKAAASEAILAAGGTITHHHAVGTDHRPYMTAEVGDVGVSLLRALKDAVDPTGILNPGKLVP
ncbi:FAD-binding oxidoreductase [Euzebya sp.]|uniref:FAD-binding oxidoreductase n=1 Tax=Euzebya sp. TaxID=1971409 RepID=UPI0035142658